MDLFEQYRGTFAIIGRYWREFGGWRAIIFSPYFHVSVGVTFLTSTYWVTEKWWDTALSVLPNITGFAIGGYAIWMGFGDEHFRRRISKRSAGSGKSPYLTVSAAFSHFVVVQLSALVIALLIKAAQLPIPSLQWLNTLAMCYGFSPGEIRQTLHPWLSGFGFLLLIYALMTAFAATFAIFRVSDWFVTITNDRQASDSCS